MSKFTRDGVERAAKQIHDHNQRTGQRTSYEETRKRVERAVTREERKRSDRGR